MFKDLREYIKQAEEWRELKVIEGADWDLEIGTITEMMAKPGTPLLLFDKIKGYPAGYRVATNLAASHRRVSLLLGLPQQEKPMELVKAWREKSKGSFTPVPPVEVKTGPVEENVHTSEDIDLYEFPTPRWHELDGGRYIGTGDIVITRDPDEGWVNFGTYRVQIHDKTTATIAIDDNHHGGIIARKYWAKGLACPAVVVCGQDPQLQLVGPQFIPWGVSEFDYAGWLKQTPIEIVRGKLSGLPIPAAAEIALEGEMVQPEIETRMEGPFGEDTGYYSGLVLPVSAFKVKTIYHRNDPILHGSPPFKQQPLYWQGRNILRSAMIWDFVDKIEPGVKGVWVTEEGLIWLMVIAVKQQYAGHAKEVALAARAIDGICRFIILVDEDIDPSNMSEVLWAFATRCNPEFNIDIIRGLHDIELDPAIHPKKRERGLTSCAAAIINACKPYEWIKDFPETIQSSPELISRVREKFHL
jgi:4-hydroxy-3-polyprenylbenzoate decarboxylase